MARPRKKKKRSFLKTVIILFVLSIILLIGAFVAYILTKTEKINTTSIDKTKIETNEVQSDTMSEGFTNIALFGLDARSGKGDSNSDTVIIASINNDTKEVKMVSVYRDTYLNTGDDDYDKANSAYAKGGAEQAMSMLNTNLDLDITEYVSVNMLALATVIDDLGGIEIDLTEEEVGYLNDYINETTEITELDTEYVSSSGLQTLNGVQATSYCRIRYTEGDDYKRTARQRLVISKIVEKAKDSDAATLDKIMNDVFPQVNTNFTKTEILKFLAAAFDYSLGNTVGFPFTKATGDAVQVDGLDAVYPEDLEANVVALHLFLFGEDENYTPSATVVDYSDTIKSLTGLEGDGIPIDITTLETDNFENSSVNN